MRNAFQVMVGIGTFLALLAAWFLWARWRRGALPASPWFYRAVVAAGPLALVALIAGWIVTEVGRQPWIVYELMRTEEAVTGADGHPGRLRDARGRLLGPDRDRPLPAPAARPQGPRLDRGGALMLADLAIAVLLVGLTAYAVLGGADFGAGFWDLTAGSAERGARVRGLVKRSMGPVWEANHVWLIFVLVILWTCFPKAFAPIMETLYVPLFLAAVGIILRGARVRPARRGGDDRRGARARRHVRALVRARPLLPRRRGRCGRIRASVRPTTPAARSTPGPTPPRSSRGCSPSSPAPTSPPSSWPPTPAPPGSPTWWTAFRARALGSALVAGALAIGGLAVIESDAPDLYDGLTSGLGLVMVIASAIAGAVTLALVWTHRFAPARVGAAVAVGSILVGMGLALRPDFLPGELSFEEAAAGDSTLLATLISVAIGLCLIVPSLAYLFRLTLAGTLHEEFQPIGARGGRSDDEPTRLAATCFVIGGVVLFVLRGRSRAVAGVVLLLPRIAAGRVRDRAPEFLAGDED